MKELVANASFLYLALGLVAVVTAIALVLLGFILTQPTRWSELVDRENDFWIGKGLVSSAAAEKFRRFEKGPGQKILTAIVSLVGLAGFITMTFLFWHQPHH